jgi:hypothetical protein
VRTVNQRGSVLMLMPAAVMVVLALGAITFDLSVVYLGEREAVDAASAAANDAVTYGLDEDALRNEGVYRLDPRRVDQAVALSLDARGLAGDLTAVDIAAVGDDGVSVTLTLTVDYVFARALPGPGSTTVTARAQATATRR